MITIPCVLIRDLTISLNLWPRSLMEAEGVERLVLLTQQKRRFSPRVVKFASQVLYSMWQHAELREVYKKGGWTESDFVAKGAGTGGRGGSPGPSGNEAR